MQILIVFAPRSVCKASCLYVRPRVWQPHFSIVIMLPDVPISQMLFSSFSTDFEYLRKSQGSVFLHNVLAKNSTEFLNKEKFVSFHSVIWSTSSPWRQHNLPNLWLWVTNLSPPTGRKRGLRLRAVCWPQICGIHEQLFQGSFLFTFMQEILPPYPVTFWLLSLISCGGILLRLHTHFTTENPSKCRCFPHFCASKLLSVSYNPCCENTVQTNKSRCVCL